MHCCIFAHIPVNSICSIMITIFAHIKFQHIAVRQTMYHAKIPRLKPIFHCKLGSRWVTNANKMSTNNMKCTWPKRKFCVGDPTQAMFHWLALDFCAGGNANFMFCVGCYANFSVFRYQHVGIPNAIILALGV